MDREFLRRAARVTTDCHDLAFREIGIAVIRRVKVPTETFRGRGLHTIRARWQMDLPIFTDPMLAGLAVLARLWKHRVAHICGWADTKTLGTVLNRTHPIRQRLFVEAKEFSFVLLIIVITRR